MALRNDQPSPPVCHPPPPENMELWDLHSILHSGTKVGKTNLSPINGNLSFGSARGHVGLVDSCTRITAFCTLCIDEPTVAALVLFMWGVAKLNIWNIFLRDRPPTAGPPEKFFPQVSDPRVFMRGLPALLIANFHEKQPNIYNQEFRKQLFYCNHNLG